MSPALKNNPKSLLRNKLKNKLAAISKATRRQKSSAVCRRLGHSDFVQEARRILIYVGRQDELDTLPLIRRLLKTGQEVYLPRMETGRIELYQVKDLKKDLQLGAYGILEPRKSKLRQGQIQEMDIAIIPGLGFTREGARLGRGAGHFDRLLAKAKRVIKIGVSYREQILKIIPAERHDVRMNFVVTD